MTSDKQVKIEVKLEKETVWLTQKQIAELFGTQRPAITKHLNNIFKSKELDKKSVCSILEHTAADGKTYKTQYYNLDVIISIGYKVNSYRATQFRIWATQTLKKHIIKGYTINEKRSLKQIDNFKDLQKTIAFLQEKTHHKLLEGQTQEIMDILNVYAKSISVLEQYDTNKLILIKEKKPVIKIITNLLR